MSSYQSFPGQHGISKSPEKWKALRAKNLFRDKRVLDVGCNEGYFCIKASKHGAKLVVGIDKDPRMIEKARARLQPDQKEKITYQCRDWNTLRNEKDFSYDVILLLSAFHYATTPSYFNPDGSNKLMNEIARILAPGGVLILECGVIERDTAEWILIKRAEDEVYHGTRPAIENLLKPLFSKVISIGQSVDQAGDPVNRYVFHCYK